mgnify:CR=1 FL=1
MISSKEIKKISAIQWSVLSALIRNGFYNWNMRANGKAICVNNVEQECYFNGVKLIIDIKIENEI